MDFKDTIIQDLEILRKNEVAQKEVFKARAYQKVINGIKALPGPVKSMDDIDGIVGVGQKIRLKIEEIITTGKLMAAEKLKNDDNDQLMQDLLKIYGVGPAKAKALVESGVASVADLRTKQHLLNQNQLIGLEMYDEFLERIPREEMKKHETYIKTVIKKLAGNESVNVTVVGSYRRGKSDSGDIDVLVAFPDMPVERQSSVFEKIIATMKERKYITHVLAEGDHKCMAVSKLVRGHQKHRRLDMLLTPVEEYPYALLYFTGSDVFNIRCRTKAREKGYSLSEHGLKPINTVAAPVMTSEKDILEFIGVEYVPPTKR